MGNEMMIKSKPNPYHKAVRTKQYGPRIVNRKSRKKLEKQLNKELKEELDAQA